MAAVRYECQNMFGGETIATFKTYEKAEEFIDAATDYPDWWAVDAMTIVEVAEDDE